MPRQPIPIALGKAEQDEEDENERFLQWVKENNAFRRQGPQLEIINEEAKNFTPAPDSVEPSRTVKRIRNYGDLQSLRDKASTVLRSPSPLRPINQRIRFKTVPKTASDNRYFIH